MGEFTVEIIKRGGVLSDERNGWKKELNYVSWDDTPPKWEIRSWSPDHKYMSKGVKFNDKSEIERLAELLEKIRKGEL